MEVRSSTEMGAPGDSERGTANSQKEHVRTTHHRGA